MSYNTPDEVKAKFKVLGEQYTDNEIQDELDRANNKLDGRVGSQMIEPDRAEIDDQEDFVLGFGKLISFDKVMKIGESDYVDSSEYSADTDKGTVSFNTDYAEDNISIGTQFKFYYVPERFKDLELWYAIKSLADTTALQTRDGENSINTENIKSNIKEIENEIKGKTGNRLVRDHRPRFYPTTTY